MSENNYLLDAIDKLTRNHITRVVQTNPQGITCTSTVDHDPLLQQLRDAVVGGIGSKGAGSDGSARIPFDAGALALFDSIAKTINAWYAELPNHVEERYLWDRLRDWYVDFENRRRAGKVSDSAEQITLKLVEGWARSIEAMFDPPITLELTKEHRVPIMLPKYKRRVIDGEVVKEPVLNADGEPVMVQKRDKDGAPMTRLVKTEPAMCPICGERYAHDPKTGDQITAIILEYRNIGTETLDKATGLCRFCTTVWRGRSGMRELRWAIDNPMGDEDRHAVA